MLRPGRPGLVLVILVAILAIGLRVSTTPSGARVVSQDASGRTLSINQSVAAAADTSTNTVVPPDTSTNTVVPPNTSTNTVVPPGTSTATLIPTITPTPLPFFYPTNTGTPGSNPVTISPPQGPAGQSITLSARAGTFPSNATISIYFTDPLAANGTVQIGTATSGYDGSLPVTNVVLPASATYGAATITLTATNGVSKTVAYFVLSSITINPATVPPGGTIQITGNGFAALNHITFMLNGNDVTASVTPNPVNTDHVGHFVATLTIPASQTLGVAQLIATDGIHPVSVQLSVGTAVATATGSPVATGSTTAVPTVTGTPPTSTLLPTARPRPRSPTPSATATPVTSPGTVVAPTGTTAYFAEGYTGTAKVNGKANFTETLSILNPNTTAATVKITYYILGTATPKTVTHVVAASSELRESVNGDVGSDAQIAAEVTSTARLYVVRTITRTAANGQRLDGSTTQPARAPATTWSFAEGYTGVTFQEYLTLLNPNSAPASVTILLAPQAATASGAHTLTVNVPPQSRATENIRALTTGNSARSVGMLISSSQPVVAERVMYFGNGSGSGKFGSTVSGGLPAASGQLRVGFGLSGGTTTDNAGKAQPSGDQDYITLLNPNASSAAQVTIGFTDATGRSLGQPVTVTVAPGTRNTVTANTAIGAKPAGPFSVTVSAAGSTIQAESAQYFGGSPNIGNHAGVALPALPQPATDVFLSDLSTRLADGTAVNRSVYLYNPNSASEQIAATYFSSNGTIAQKTYTVGASSITTVNVNQDTPASAAGNPIGAEFKVSTGGSFVAYAIGRTPDNLAAFEEVGAAAS